MPKFFSPRAARFLSCGGVLALSIASLALVACGSDGDAESVAETDHGAPYLGVSPNGPVDSIAWPDEATNTRDGHYTINVDLFGDASIDIETGCGCSRDGDGADAGGDAAPEGAGDGGITRDGDDQDAGAPDAAPPDHGEDAGTPAPGGEDGGGDAAAPPPPPPDCQ